MDHSEVDEVRGPEKRSGNPPYSVQGPRRGTGVTVKLGDTSDESRYFETLVGVRGLHSLELGVGARVPRDETSDLKSPERRSLCLNDLGVHPLTCPVGTGPRGVATGSTYPSCVSCMWYVVCGV